MQKFLNLSEDFKPCQTDNSNEIKFKSFKFNGGEPHIIIKHGWSLQDSIVITTRINTSDDLILLSLAVNALDNIGLYAHKHLILPYMPGARQDRIMIEGEPLSVKVYADIINKLDFNSVEILDCHSDVTLALLNNTNYGQQNSWEAISYCFR